MIDENDVLSQEQYKKKLGQQANEIGELRKVIDDYILKENQVTADKYAQDPLQATEKLIEQKMKPLEQSLAAQAAREAEEKVAAVHPDYKDVLQNESFQQWVNSSKMRTAGMQAAINGDIDAGIELLNEFKSGASGSNAKLQAATTSVRGSSRDTGTRQDGIYRRADLIRMKIEDPARYRELNAEIMKAYAEGRVK